MGQLMVKPVSTTSRRPSSLTAGLPVTDAFARPPVDLGAPQSVRSAAT